jgi:hypothetical protein
MKRLLTSMIWLNIAAFSQVPALVSTYQTSNDNRPSGPVGVVATKADSFVNSTGVATHWSYSSYVAVMPQLIQLLIDSGIRHIRDGGAHWLDPLFIELADHNIHTNLVVDPNLGTVPNSTYWCNEFGRPRSAIGLGGLPPCFDLIQWLDQIGPNVVDSVETLNECNIYCGGMYWLATDPASHRPRLMFDPTNTFWLNASHYRDPGVGWAPYAAAFTKDTCDAIHEDGTLNGRVLCIGPTIGGGDLIHRYDPGSMYGHVDLGASHPYPGGEGRVNSGSYDGVTGTYGEGTNEPGGSINSGYTFTSYGPAFTNGVHAIPWAVTETGYHTYVTGATGPQNSTHEDTEAKYLPRLFAEFWRAGIIRTFIYELYDEGTKVNSSESHFGLIHHDLTPKPAYTAIASLLHLLQEPNAPSFQPAALTYAESVEPNGAFTRTQYVHDLLLQKSTGEFYLLLWHEIADECVECVPGVFNQGENTYLSPLPLTTTITLPANILSASLYTYDSSWELQEAPLAIESHQIVVQATDKVSVIKLSANYAAFPPVAQTSAVLMAQTIAFDILGQQTVGKSLVLTATASSGLPVTISSYSLSICSVSGNTVSFLSAGTCTIAASQGGNAAYAPATLALQTFGVLNTQTINFDPIPVQETGTRLALNATASSGLPITYTTLPENICTASGNTAFFLAPGICTIGASQPGNTLYLAADYKSQSFSVKGLPAGAMLFIPVAPCRIVDTRDGAGPNWAGEARDVLISDSFANSCGIPTTATAFSLNVTAVPLKTLGFLTIWPTGQPRPNVSTLNSWDGRIKANSAIVDAGTNGQLSVYVSDVSHFILDIDGYFVTAPNPSALAFHPVSPCRIVDTRNPAGPLGGPHMTAGEMRSFVIPASSCNLPDTAGAYSLNFTVVPHGKLGYLSTWPTGQSRPLVSTLNALGGEVTSNAAIVPAGTKGSISVYVTDDADVVIDANGYFGPQTSHGLSLYSISPCRVLDTRSVGDKQPFLHTREVNVTGSACSIPPTAQTVVTNATVVPEQKLGFLSLWPVGEAQPYVSTLNAFDGSTTSNMAIIPISNGSVDAYVTDPTHLILDASGYFAP